MDGDIQTYANELANPDLDIILTAGEYPSGDVTIAVFSLTKDAGVEFVLSPYGDLLDTRAVI